MLHSVLMEILEYVLKPRMDLMYAIQSYCCLSVKNEKAFRSYRYIAWPLTSNTSCLNRIDQILSQSINCVKSIFVVKSDEVTVVARDKILDALKVVINEHIVKVFRKFYVQEQGIAQGSILSVILCNLYLARMEKQFFENFVSEKEDLLMRHVDDFLFVTPKKEKAVKFAK